MVPSFAIRHRRIRALTPYFPDTWESALKGTNLLSRDPNIPEGLCFSFHAGLSNLSQTYSPHNSPSVEEHKDIFNEIINREFAKGHYIGPFNHINLKALIGPFQSAPLSLVPKPEKPGKFCLVQNLSFPYKPSLSYVLSPNS